MTKVVSSRGQVVDFEMMKIMNDINSPKPSSNTPKPKKLYELPEEEIPFVDSYSTEELLKKHLETMPKVETVMEPLKIVEPINKVDEVKTVEEPVPLIITEPVNEMLSELISEPSDNVKDNNHEKRRR